MPARRPKTQAERLAVLEREMDEVRSTQQAILSKQDQVLQELSHYRGAFGMALSRAGSVPYGWWDLVGVAIRERFGWNVRFGLKVGEVCSEMVARLIGPYMSGDLVAVPSPGLLYQELAGNYKTSLRCRARSVTTD